MCIFLALHILSQIATDTHAHVRTRARTHTHLHLRHPQYHTHTHFSIDVDAARKVFFLDGSLHHGWHNFVSLVSQLSAVQLSIPSCSIIPVDGGCGPQDYMLAASSSVTLDLSSSTSLLMTLKMNCSCATEVSPLLPLPLPFPAFLSLLTSSSLSGAQYWHLCNSRAMPASFFLSCVVAARTPDRIQGAVFAFMWAHAT